MIKPKSSLSAAIISSLITKTIHLLKTVNDDKLPAFYTGHNFIWITKPDKGSPNLQIISPTEKWTIWWNGKYESKLRVKSNVEVDAENNLSLFLDIENILIAELSSILNKWQEDNAYKVELNDRTNL